MGCDIHPIAEVKENGVWRINTDKVFKNPYYREEEVNKSKGERWESAVDKYNVEPSSGRNYDWFSILADVRNGYGFAGVPTGQGFDVIKQPNGFPDDISKEALINFCIGITDDPELEYDDENDVYHVLRKDASRWVEQGSSKFITIDGKDYVSDPDLHSQSFITAEEFDKFDWNQLTMKTGVITLKQYEELRGTNESPQMWSGLISGGDILVVSEEEADKILKSKTDIPLTKQVEPWVGGEPITKPASEWSINVHYSWSVLYSEWFEHNIKDTVKPLQELAKKYEDARMVFGFDN